MIKLTPSVVDLTETLRELDIDVRVKIRHLLEGVGAEVIAYLRSLTDNMADPVRPGDGPRRRHPGNWADITGNLANAYAWRVYAEGSTGMTLELSNSMDYAVYLEARDGYFVLRGVTEDDGPVDRALREVIRRVAPDWRVVNG